MDKVELVLGLAPTQRSPLRPACRCWTKQRLRQRALGDHLRVDAPESKGWICQAGLIGLDPAIFDRPKSGFVLPLEVWCRRDLADLVQGTLLDRSLCESVGLSPDAVARLWSAFQAGAPGLYWSRIWAVFIVLWWSRRYGVTRA